MINKKDLWDLKYILIYGLLVVIIFAYSGAVGWKIFGSNTDKWEADGPGNHSSRGNSGRYRSNFYHK